LKTGTYRYDNNEAPISQTVGGFGDMGFDYARKFGKTEAGSITIGMGLPTGKYDHRRYDPKKTTVEHASLVTPELQAGTGIYNGSLSAEYTIDKDWGPIIIGCSYSAPFLELVDLVRGGAQNDVWEDEKNINEDMKGTSYMTTYGNWYQLPEPDLDLDSIYGPSLDTARYLADHARWAQEIAIKRKYYTLDGKELRGDFFGSSVGVKFAMGYKEESCVHSFQFGYSYKLAPEWYVRRINEMDATKWRKENLVAERVQEWYTAPVQRDRHSWNLSYGLEMSSMYFPVFMAGTMTIDGKRNLSFSSTLGVKGSFF
jgi:hypothetical protein